MRCRPATDGPWQTRAIGNGIGHRAGAERALQAGNRWSVADAGTVVDVVGLKNRARHLLEHVDVFIG